MEKTFDFEKMGKRMPYTVPDDFFADMEKSVLKSLTPSPIPVGEGSEYSQMGHNVKTHTTPLWRRMGVGLFLAAAAAVALFLVVQPLLTKSSTADFETVELAFNDLSTDDQDFLIAVYEDEEYMNDLTTLDDEL